MTEKQLVWIGVIASLASLYITYRIAEGLQKAQKDINTTADTVKKSPLGMLAKLAGLG